MKELDGRLERERKSTEDSEESIVKPTHPRRTLRKPGCLFLRNRGTEADEYLKWINNRIGTIGVGRYTLEEGNNNDSFPQVKFNLASKRSKSDCKPCTLSCFVRRKPERKK
jgi:hypothetical protein